MITAFKTFWSDCYRMVLRPTLAWVRRLWGGYLVFVGLCVVFWAAVGHLLWWFVRPLLDDKEDSSDEEE